MCTNPKQDGTFLHCHFGWQLVFKILLQNNYKGTQNPFQIEPYKITFPPTFFSPFEEKKLKEGLILRYTGDLQKLVTRAEFEYEQNEHHKIVLSEAQCPRVSGQESNLTA